MAQRFVTIIPAAVAAAFVLALSLGTLVAVAYRAGLNDISGADWAAIRFTLWQAMLSAGLSVGLAIPVARALARRHFPGRSFLITVMGAPFLLPVIVAVLGLLAVFGRGGLVNTSLTFIGLEPISIFGLQGVLLAHVFFNLPLATRMIMQGWADIPAERFRLAASLDLPIGPFLERPMLRRIVPGALLVIFLICLTSFAVALILGGGPRATTVELAIYQAILFDFNLGQAALLALVQFTFCAVAAAMTYFTARPEGFGAGLGRPVARWDTASPIWDSLWIILAAVFLMAPLAMILADGLQGLVRLDMAVFAAFVRSVCVALASTVLCLVLALALAMRREGWAQLVGVLPLATSGLVMGTGLFLMTFPYIAPRDIALPVTVMVNALLALPFAYRILLPAVEICQQDYARLSAQLGLTGWRYLRIVLFPQVRAAIGFAAGVAAALSMGDLGVITLFAGEAEATLPLLMFRLMGSYQMDAAAGVGLVLTLTSFALFWVCDWGGRRHAQF